MSVPARNLARGILEAVRVAEAQQSGARKGRVETLKEILSGRGLHAVWQPLRGLSDRSVLGYEALIRGPAGSELEMPDALFTVAREGDMLLELENLCLETIFSSLPRAVRSSVLFVNASARLLTHPVFLDERNLAAMKRAHASIVVEVSEKEIVWNYPAFREVLERLRAAGFRFAIDDTGSGYSGLETILQLRPGVHEDRHVDRPESSIRTRSSERSWRASFPSADRSARRSWPRGSRARRSSESLVELGIPYGQGFLLGKPAARISAAP